MEENKPKKSRAFLITLIIMIIILIIGYVVFTHKDQIFGTKSATTSGQNFTPLSSSGSQKGVSTVNSTQGGGQNTGNTTTNGNPTANTNATTGSTTSGSFGNGATNTSGNGAGNGTGLTTGDGFTPPTTGPLFNPIPAPGPNYTPPDVTLLPDLTNTDQGNQPPTVTPAPPLCPDDPLVFTDTEKAELDDLVKQYYLLAPTLKTSDDTLVIQNDINQNQAIIDQANSLTAECQSEKADPAYTGPQAIKSNPYYTNTSPDSPSYLPGQTSDWITNNLNPTNVPDFLKDYADFEKKFNIW